MRTMILIVLTCSKGGITPMTIKMLTRPEASYWFVNGHLCVMFNDGITEYPVQYDNGIVAWDRFHYSSARMRKIEAQVRKINKNKKELVNIYK
jgi:hypothetical protein